MADETPSNSRQAAPEPVSRHAGRLWLRVAALILPRAGFREILFIISALLLIALSACRTHATKRTHDVANGSEAITVVLAEMKRRGGDLAHWDFYTRQAERPSEGWYVVAQTNGVPVTSYVVSPDGRVMSETPAFGFAP